MRAKPELLILAQKNLASNPMVYMYLKALRPEYETTIACSDSEVTGRVYPGVECVSIKPNRTTLSIIRQSVRSVMSLASRGKVNQSASGEVVAAPALRPQRNSSKGRGLDLGFLARYIYSTVISVIHLLRLQRSSIIIVFDGEALATARVLATIWRVPYMYAVCEMWPNQFSEYSRKRSLTMALIEKWGLNGATKAVVGDETWVTLLVRRYGICRAKFVKIRTCPAVPARSAVREIVAPLRVYYHGGYMPKRGLENVILAMSQVPGAHLYLRGYGVLEPTLRGLVCQNDLQERVTFLEPVPMPKLADAATEFDVGIIVACPITANARFGLGYKSFEYLAAGLAIACTNTHTLGPLLKRHSLGIAFKGCEVEAIATTLQYCVDHPEQVVLWKKQARFLAESEFNDEVQGARLRQVVAEYLATK